MRKSFFEVPVPRRRAPRWRSYYSSDCCLGLSVSTTNYSGSFPFPFNAGIAVKGYSSSYSPGLIFTNNTFTIQETNSLVGCAGIGLDHVWLDANLDNFTNNSFYNWSGLTNVHAYGYPLDGATNYPNTNSDSTIDTIIYPLNSWQ